MKERLLRFFLGHHKCGTQWIQGILRQLCSEMGLNYHHAYTGKKFNGNMQEYFANKQVDVFAYTNADYNYLKQMQLDYRGFHVIRDPRDLVVSAYFSHLYSHPTEQNPRLKKEREILKTMSKDEGLIQEIKFNHEVFQQMYNWNYKSEDILEVKLEDLAQNPYLGFVNIFRFLGIVGENIPATLQEKWNYLLIISARNLQKKLFK